MLKSLSDLQCFSSQTLVRRLLRLGPGSLERRLKTLRRYFNFPPAAVWSMLIYNDGNSRLTSRSQGIFFSSRLRQDDSVYCVNFFPSACTKKKLRSSLLASSAKMFRLRKFISNSMCDLSIKPNVLHNLLRTSANTEKKRYRSKNRAFMAANSRTNY